MSDKNVESQHQVLVIDDSPMMRKFLQGMLRRDFQVIEKESAAQGLEWIYFNDKPDLVILDLNMKGMNGHEFLKRIQSDPAVSGLKILVLSGEKKSAERIKCLELGAMDYVVKPFNPKELYLRIKKLIAEPEVFISSEQKAKSDEWTQQKN
ncbi:MAG: response regulator [Bacteroidia bacterium]|nr:response regulator [Bacteroidia bacterium]